MEPPATCLHKLRTNPMQPRARRRTDTSNTLFRFSSIHEKGNLMIHFDHALPGAPCFNKTLPAVTGEQLCECAIVELDHAQLPRRTLDARQAIPDRAEEILTRPSCDEHTAPSIPGSGRYARLRK
jgi:hypothetical protein